MRQQTTAYRRTIRFLVPYNRTLYFVDKGRERGIAAELARDFERYVNQKYAARLPATGKQMDVGSISIAESNVHAGAKYMDQLVTS